MERIVVGIDVSETSRRALRWALESHWVRLAPDRITGRRIG